MASTQTTRQITGLGTEPSPLDYLVPSSSVIGIEGVTATFDGSGVGSPWVPCVQIITDSGHVLASCPATAALAGDVVEVTFAPFLRKPGGGVEVTDGVTTVNPATEIDFTSGAVVTNLGGGIAGVDVPGPTHTFTVVVAGAYVNADGTIRAGNMQCTKIGTGTYHVFTTQVWQGNFGVASAHNPFGSLPSYNVALFCDAVDGATLLIATTNPSGVLVDCAFAVIMMATPLIPPTSATIPYVGDGGEF